MKIGLPKIRMSRKLLFIVLGITVLLGGTGAAALYIGTDKILGKTETKAVGGECFDVQTMVAKTPSKHLWLRKFIRMENADGPERVRTAMRIAGLLAKDNAVDLIHVSVLDSKGPAKRADMRHRAIGAEVLIAMHPENLPEMKVPAKASYYEGMANDEGKFYGEKVSLDFDEVRTMMTSMREVNDKTDCIKPEVVEDPAAKDKHGKKKDHKKPEHGEKPASEHGEKPAADHGEQPAAEHGDEAKPAEHGDKPAENAAEHGEKPAKEQSFMDSMLGMVGLGGSEEPAAESHEASTAKEGEHQTPASEDGHEAKPEDHGEQPAADHGEQAKPEDHGEKPAETSAEHGEEPAKEKSMVDSMLGFVGLGDSEEPVPEDHKADATKEGEHTAPASEDGHEAKTEDHGEKPAAEHEAKPADHSEEPVAEAAKDDHEAKAENHAEKPVAEHDAGDKAAEHEAKPADHGQEPAAELETGDKSAEHEAKPAEHGHEPAADPAKDGHEAKAEEHGEKPAAGHEEGDKAAEHEAKTADHDEKPVADPAKDGHEAKAEDHGEKPAAEHEAGDKAAEHETKPAEHGHEPTADIASESHDGDAVIKTSDHDQSAEAAAH